MADPGSAVKINRRKACDSCRRKKTKCEWVEGTSCALCIQSETECKISLEPKEKKRSLKRLQNTEISSKQADQIVTLLKKISKTLPPKGNRANLPPIVNGERFNDASPLASVTEESDFSPEDWNSTRGKIESLFESLRNEENLFSESSVEDQSSNYDSRTDLLESGSRGFANNDKSVPKAKDNLHGMRQAHYQKPESSTTGSLESLDGYFLPSTSKLTPLPALDEAISLVDDYFESFNRAVPIYNKAAFMRLVLQHDLQDGNKQEGSGWWASLNIVLALAHRLRAMRTSSPEEENQKSWGYLRNALELLPELTLHNKDLLSVQALLGMAVFLQGTAMPYPAYSLIAAAIRQLHSLGLHRQSTSLKTEETKQQKRVFWIAYFLDKDISLRTSQPFVQNEYEMDVEIPSTDDNGVGHVWLRDGSKSIDIFHLRVELSIIQGRIYRDLYSVSAEKQSNDEKLWRIRELDTIAKNWEDLIPEEFRPENMTTTLDASSMLNMSILYILYYNCLVMIHTKAREDDRRRLPLSTESATSNALRWSEDICVSGARAILQLLHYLPQGDYACIWLNIFIFYDAFQVLISNISQHPFDKTSQSDLNLAEFMYNLVDSLGTCGQAPCLAVMYKDCTELLSTAKHDLNNARRGVMSMDVAPQRFS